MMGLRRFARREDGTVAIEFGIIGLVFFMVTIGTIEVGRMLFLHNELSYVADRAMRAILIDPTATGPALEAVVEAAAIGLVAANVSATFGTESVSGAEYRTILIQYPFTPLVPGFADNLITLSSSRRVPG